MTEAPAGRPFGSWPSPLAASDVVAAGVGLGGPLVAGDGAVWWSEARPEEGGRIQLLRRDPGDGSIRGVLPEGWSARTRVHEYGGGAWWVDGETVFFAAWADQRLHRLDPGGEPVALTPEPVVPGGDRYADGVVTPDGAWLLCVRERHEPGAGDHDAGHAEPRNELVAIRARPPVDGAPEEPVVVVAGHDFVSHPRIDPSGRYLSWLAWEHPRMPWDGTELWVADLALPVGDAPGAPAVSGGEVVLGGPEVSVAQPSWAPDGRLTAVADVDGWWNLWSAPAAGRPAAGSFEQTSVVDGELAQPQWVFGQSWYGHLPAGGIVGSWRFDGVDHLGVLAPGAASPRWLDVPWTSVAGLDVGAEGTVAVIASSFSAEAVVSTVGMDGAVEVVRPARELALDESWWSVPEHIAFPSTDGRTAHALWYPPRNPRCTGPEGEAPPLLVLGHGGPTSAARPQLDLAVQYWTTRGWGVVDVNYGGSTGYGRAYRRLLDGAWGVVDVDDLAAAAEHLAGAGLADPSRVAVKGGSAGGYTVLCLLAFRDTCSVGASRYGIADLEALVADTHKFEVHYTDTLIAPYPEGRDVYRERSPIHHLERFDAPLLVLQGLEDAVVPPNQSEMIVDALEARGVPVAYLAFEGEQHGFRRAQTIQRALEAEHYFFSEVLGLAPADDLEPVAIRRGAARGGTG